MYVGSYLAYPAVAQLVTRTPLKELANGLARIPEVKAELRILHGYHFRDVVRFVILFDIVDHDHGPFDMVS